MIHRHRRESPDDEPGCCDHARLAQRLVRKLTTEPADLALASNEDSALMMPRLTLDSASASAAAAATPSAAKPDPLISEKAFKTNVSIRLSHFMDPGVGSPMFKLCSLSLAEFLITMWVSHSELQREVNRSHRDCCLNIF